VVAEGDVLAEFDRDAVEREGLRLVVAAVEDVILSRGPSSGSAQT
jgi:hypothetical protein